MNNGKKVIHLADYLNQELTIKDFDRYKPISRIEKNDPNLIKRACAFGFDLASIGFLKTLLHSSFLIFVGEFLSPFSYVLKKEISTPSIGIHVGLFALIYMSYFVLSGLFLDGNTLGKKIMGLKVINNNFSKDPTKHTHELSIKQIFQRSFGQLVCYLSFGTFFVFHFSSEDKRGLADFISNTKTVSNEWFELAQNYKEYDAEIITIDIETLEQAA